jgi:hypothetical protein
LEFGIWCFSGVWILIFGASLDRGAWLLVLLARLFEADYGTDSTYYIDGGLTQHVTKY